MDRSFSALAHGAAIAAAMVFVAIGPHGRQSGASPVAAAAQSAPAPTAVSANGVTLRSVSVDNPDSDRTFAGPGGRCRQQQLFGLPFRRHGSDAASPAPRRLAGRGREDAEYVQGASGRGGRPGDCRLSRKPAALIDALPGRAPTVRAAFGGGQDTRLLFVALRPMKRAIPEDLGRRSSSRRRPSPDNLEL
jgi:pyruvate/2-oxoglutarate dehydrogenase complex dihydrolipoamide acyltransferase (E2) component